jgi:L-alanine-DL-glutamate epimerase-like enolase superfamily enzyme
MIRVAALEVVTWPLQARDALRRWSERRALLLTLEGGGTGEAAPLPGYSPDTLEACRAALAALPPLTGELDDLRHVPRSLPAARFALETALLARRGGLGLPARPVARSRLVDSVAAAAAALAAGAAVLKVKVGVPGDVELLAALRDRFPGVPLRLDANGTPVGAAHAAFAPELVEEPADPAAPHPFPVALDESLQRLPFGAVRALARAGRVQALVLKPMALGGALRCLELARRAVELDLAVCASHLHDGPVARAATRALAEALPGRVLACGV